MILFDTSKKYQKIYNGCTQLTDEIFSYLPNLTYLDCTNCDQLTNSFDKIPCLTTLLQGKWFCGYPVEIVDNLVSRGIDVSF